MLCAHPCLCSFGYVMFLLFSHIYICIKPFSKTLGVLFKISPYFSETPGVYFPLPTFLFSFLDQIFFKTLENSFKNFLDLSKIFQVCIFKSLSVSPAFYLILLISSLPQYHFDGVRFSRCCLSQRSCLLSDTRWIPGSSGHPVSSFLPSVVLFLVRHLLAYVPRPLG